MSWLKNPASFKKIFFALTLVYFLVILFNDGFMGTDEYWTGITRYIPAQNSTLHHLVTIEDVKSPLQILPMHLIAQAALLMGAQHPYLQYRIVVFTIGLICISVLLFAFSLLFNFTNQPKQLTDSEKTSNRNVAFLLLGFYCAAPFAFTRPMFESMAAPWLTLSAVYLYLYDQTEQKRHLLFSVLTICLAFMLRQQTGICALVVLLIPMIKKKWKDVLLAATLGLLIFILLGIPDIFLRGDFHHSLKAVLFYNVAHGQEYGQQSIFTYPLMLIAISFLPFLIKKYNPHFVRQELKDKKVFLLYILFFTTLHSLFPQKFERFLISIIPHVLILMVPFLSEIFLNAHKHRVRIALMLALNFAIYIPASFFPAQKNLIETSLYFDEHPEIHRVYRLPDSPPWITDAFIQEQKYQFIDTNEEAIEQLALKDDEFLILNGHDYQRLGSRMNRFNKVAQFDVNWIESFAYRFNPSKNIRRSPLILFK